MEDEKTPVPTTPSSLKKGTLSDQDEDKMFAVVEEEIAPTKTDDGLTPVATNTPVEDGSAPTEVAEVYADKIIYKNKMAKKSMSVWQVQRRLFDLGYAEVREAKPGYFEEVTLKAVEDYRADKNLGDGEIDVKFLKSLFAGDKTVKLILP
jgi:peptidoglycan hydrolase-like protein with peptidoglycan-binding domain